MHRPSNAIDCSAITNVSFIEIEIPDDGDYALRVSTKFQGHGDELESDVD